MQQVCASFPLHATMAEFRWFRLTTPSPLCRALSPLGTPPDTPGSTFAASVTLSLPCANHRRPACAGRASQLIAARHPLKNLDGVEEHLVAPICCLLTNQVAKQRPLASHRTLERWLYRVRRAHQDPVAALNSRRRSAPMSAGNTSHNTQTRPERFAVGDIPNLSSMAIYCVYRRWRYNLNIGVGDTTPRGLDL